MAVRPAILTPLLRFAAAILFFASFVAVRPAPAQDLSAAHAEHRIIVRFAAGASASERATLRQALLPREARALPLVAGMEAISTGLDVPQALAALANNPNVVYAEPDYLLQPIELPDDVHFPLLWGLHNTGQDIRGSAGVVDADTDMPEAWEVMPGAEIIVAIIDTGTKWDHEDLAANIWQNVDELPDGIDNDGNGYVDDLRGWDFFDNDADPADEDGHGTHTAGTVGAVRNNGLGISGICGQCRLMPLRFLGPQGGFTSDAIDALGYAVANGATVSNNSWGGGPYSQALFEAIEAAGAAGHVFVAAAGNASKDNDTSPDYPSSYALDNIVSVAATTNQDQLAYFSNFGATSVDIGAPGYDIASTYRHPQTGADDYWWNSGTSMAAPHVAGVVALLQHQDPLLSPAELIEILIRSARPTQALAGLTVAGGVLNADNALRRVYPEPVDPPPPPPPPSIPAAPADLNAVDSGNGSALLTWTAVEHATYYLVEREERRKNGRRTGGTWYEVAASVAVGDTESFEDATGPHEYLYFRIAAGNNFGNSVMSDWVHVAVSDPSGGDGDGGGSGRCHPKKGC
ncbi:MAG: S8 family serine peptidase [Woeseiaceae bacterium]|nr:S8 family serine peptidase [Woeseiaceae bacterium]